MLVATYCAVTVVLALIIYNVLILLLRYVQIWFFAVLSFFGDLGYLSTTKSRFLGFFLSDFAFNHLGFCLLKRIPNGKWQCPSCFEGKDQRMPINHLDPISKRARTKIVTTKSKDQVSSLNLEKVFGTKLISKKRSSSKGKPISSMGANFFGKNLLSSPADETCSNKPIDPSLESPMEGTSSGVNADEKKLSLASTESPMDRKSTSPAKEDEPLSKITSLEANDEQLEGKTDLSCNKIPLRKTLVLAIAASGEEVRKRKNKVVNDNTSQKKRKAEKGKKIVNPSSIKSKSGNNKVHKKQKSITHSISASVSKEDVGNKNSSAQQKDEVLVLLSNILLDFYF